MAESNPYGLVALRMRGVKYVWAGVSLLVLAVIYVAPTLAALRQPTIPAAKAALPSLTLPNFSVPLLKVPKVHRLAPLPPLHHAAPATQSAVTPVQQPVAQHAVRRRVPVVSDSHAQAPKQTTSGSATAKDPFANVPVVGDSVGTPVALPSSSTAAAPTAPATAPSPSDDGTTPTSAGADGATPAPPATSSTTTSDYGYMSVELSNDPIASAPQADASAATGAPAAAAAPAAPPVQVTATIGSSDTGTIDAGQTAQQILSATGGTTGTVDSSATPQSDSTAAPAVAGTTQSSAGGATATGADTPSVESAAAGTSAGSGSSANGGSAADATVAAPLDDSVAGASSADASAPDPNANTSSGLSPPAGSGLVTAAAGGSVTSADGLATVTFAPGAVASDVTVTVTKTSSWLGTSYDLKAVDASGALVETFATAPVLTLHYDTAKPAPSSIYYVDPVNGSTPIASSVDASAHTISAALHHFSVYSSSTPDAVTVTVTTLTPVLNGPLLPAIVNVHVDDITQGGPAESATVTITTTGGVVGIASPLTCTTNSSGDCLVPIVVTPVTPIPGVMLVSGQVIGSAAASISIPAIVTYIFDWNVLLGSSDSSATVTTTAATDADHPATVNVTVGGTTRSAPAADVTSLTVDATSAAATTFDVSNVQSNFTNPITLKGSAAADTYKLGNGYGNVSIQGASSDTLNFDGNTGHVDYDGTHFVDGSTGDQASVSGVTQIDLALSSATATLQQVKDAVDNVFGAISQAVTTIDQANAELSNALPLFGLSGPSSIDKVVGIVDSFGQLAAQIHADFASFNPSVPTLSDIIARFNTLLASLPQISTGINNPLGNLQLTTSYGSAGGHLIFYVDATLSGGTFHRSIPLDFGATLTSLGIALDSNPTAPGNQAPTFDVTAGIGANLGVGIDVSSPSIPFLRRDGSVNLTVSASLTSATAKLSLGILSASISTTGITFNGGASLALNDPNSSDDGITVSEITGHLGSIFTPSVSGTITSPITIAVNFDSGVQIGTTDLSAGATLYLCFTGTCPASSTPTTAVSIFDAPTVNVNVTTSATDLFSSFSNATNFSNIGPNGIISMLSQIAGFFESIAGQSFLGQQIPFTSISIGQVLDYAKQFKHDILDPLFKSGDASKPDANGDGQVDFSDFNFSSIQDLLNRLTNALGLGTPLKATYDPGSGDLTFPFSFNDVFGIGTGASVLQPGIDLVSSAAARRRRHVHARRGERRLHGHVQGRDERDHRLHGRPRRHDDGRHVHEGAHDARPAGRRRRLRRHDRPLRELHDCASEYELRGRAVPRLLPRRDERDPEPEPGRAGDRRRERRHVRAHERIAVEPGSDRLQRQPRGLHE